MEKTRREFLAVTAGAVGAAAVAGCAAARGSRTCGGAAMRDFTAPKLARVRVGVVGVGARGAAACRRLTKVPGVEIVAICDLQQRRLDESRAAILEDTGRAPKVYGPDAEGFRRLCGDPDVAVVYNATSWDAHVPVAVCAMEAGKHVLIEVPSALYLEECWELVETAERCRVHCLQLENCCYGEEELLALNLCRLGMLGELLHGEGGYIHDRRWQIFNDGQWERWRNHWNERHAGNYYSTHGLGPICMNMGINRGDRLDYLVSVDGVQRGYELFAANTLPAGHPLRHEKFAMADMNVTTIRTAKGRTILLEHDVSTPRPYSRLNLIAGTKGVFRSWPRLDVFLEGRNTWPTNAGHHAFDDRVTAEIRETYRHPLYRVAGEIARRVGGHGGMDFMMDLRWVYCLQNGLPMDTDVYDLASWCAVGELSERSARNRSQAMDIPDFTRGAWTRACNSPLMDATLDLSKIDFGDVRAAQGQLNV